MKNILVPTDFSENANQALAQAILTFPDSETRFLLVHVYRMPYSGAVISVDLDDLLMEEREEQLEKQLVELRAKHPTIHITGRTLQGAILDVITRLIKAEDIDFVVMGTTGATGAKGVFLGSNAANMVKHSSVPVMLIPIMTELRPLKTLVLATDLKHIHGYETMHPIHEIAKQSGAILEILHLEDLDDVPIDVERETLLLDTVFSDLPHNFHVEPLLQPEDDIMEFADEINADLVIVVARNYGFFERLFHRSTSRKLSMVTNRPLLVLMEHV
jgi:nucleotide-binding universal stress UspA family protein